MNIRLLCTFYEQIQTIQVRVHFRLAHSLKQQQGKTIDTKTILHNKHGVLNKNHCFMDFNRLYFNY